VINQFSQTLVKIFGITIQVAVVLTCITVHEFSHALCAYQLGDDTAKRQGRLSLNPLKHLDILGALMLLFAHFGWAKPVPINPYNFKDMKYGMALTALAGPASNFALAILAAIIFRGVASYASMQIIQMICATFVMFNVALGLFNLIPIPPLDGSRIIGAFMSDDVYFRWVQWERNGTMLLMIIFLVNWVFNLRLFQFVIEKPLAYIVYGLLQVAW